MYFLNDQLGRILLGIALVLTIGAISMNPSASVEAMPDTKREVVVELNKAALAELSKESYFVADSPLTASNRCVFEPEKQVVIFQPIELDIPTPGVKRPAQLLPEPGPSLEGSEKLPRWGDEFPKPKASNAASGALGDAKPKAVNATPGAVGDAKSTTPPTAPKTPAPAKP